MAAGKRKTIRVLVFLFVVLFVVLFLTGSVLAAVKTFRAVETDFIKITPESIDPDDDEVFYHYSPPLDDLGEWQTDYGDAGEYDVEVIASDGQSESKKNITIIVLPKNQPPRLKENKILVKESQEVSLTDLVLDPDDDPLTFNFSFPFNSQGAWQTGYDDEGTYVIAFSASDGEFTEKFRVEIDVAHTNQPPEIISAFSEKEIVEIDEGAELKFYVKAVDRDDHKKDISYGDGLTYEWKFDGTIISEKESGQRDFSYDDTGEHNLSVVVNDGKKVTERSWKINVNKVNRLPKLELLPIIAYEGDSIVIEVPEKDLDGDVLTYEFEDPLDDTGRWTVGFDDAGHYEVNIKAFDGEDFGGGKVEITILDVDRKPTLRMPEKVYLQENEQFHLIIDSDDPDGDALQFYFEDLPEGASFDEDTMSLSWEPGYDFIRRSGGFISELLNALRVEDFFLKERKVPVKVTSCGKDLCAETETTFVVANVNRAPLFIDPGNITIKETETLDLDIIVEDPDGDIVRYFFGSPLGRRDGKWKTGFWDADIYHIPVTASDGHLETTMELTIIVKNNNRMPELTIRDDEITVNELEEFSFSVTASDPDNDNLTIRLENIPPEASFEDGLFTWSPPYTAVAEKTENRLADIVEEISFLNKHFSPDEEIVWLNFIASDGEFDVVHPVKVKVKNQNQAPQVLDILPAEKLAVQMFEPVIFHAAVKDQDGDALDYRWDFGLGEKEVTGTDTIERTFTSSGKKKVVFMASDGREEVRHEFTVDVVKQEYAAPVIEAIEQPPMTFKVLVVNG